MYVVQPWVLRFVSESFCFLIESISDQKAADTNCLLFPWTYTQLHVSLNIKYCSWLYVCIYIYIYICTHSMTLLTLFLTLHAFVKSTEIFATLVGLELSV